MYDYLIVGAGLFGSTFAYKATKAGKKCLVIDKRTHIGGNCYTSKQAGIHVHEYGAHIFRTSNKYVWNFLSQFCEFSAFVNTPMAVSKGRVYNMPFNMNTFSRVWPDVVSPFDAKKIIDKQRAEIIGEPRNLEEKAISLVGRDLFNIFIKGYTEKQWGRDCKDLPPDIIRRIPVRFTYNNNYFNDCYQGIPIGGYSQIFQKMLADCDVQLETDFCNERDYFMGLAKRIVYTGPIDEFFEERHGKLEYRSLKFETELLNDTDNYQGVAVVNYLDYEIPYTRIIEHKHFEWGRQPHTIITREYPVMYDGSNERYYPINDNKNNELYGIYKTEANKLENVVFGGRLGEYRYYDMQDTILSATELAISELGLKAAL